MKMNEAGLILSRGKDVRKVNILMMKEEAEKLAEMADFKKEKKERIKRWEGYVKNVNPEEAYRRAVELKDTR